MIKIIIGGAALIVFVISLLFIISTAVEQFEKASNTLRREDEDDTL